MTVPVIASDGVLVIPLFTSPLRTFLALRPEITGEQLRTLGGFVQKHLHELGPIIDTLKAAGWKVSAEESSLICSHPSVRNRNHAKLALQGLYLHDNCWLCDSTGFERLFPKLADEKRPTKES
jgi:hypothetical protein